MATKKSKKKNKNLAKKVVPKKKHSALLPKIGLYTFSLLLPIIFFQLPANSNWVKVRPLTYYKAMGKQMENMDVESRKKERHGTTFLIADYACKNIPKGSWFLMPPQAYYLDKLYDYKKPKEVREPYHFISLLKVFNFHCQDLNLLTIKMDDKEIEKAEYTISLTRGGGIQVVKIVDAKTLDKIKKEFSYGFESTNSAKGALDILTQIQSK